MENTQKSPIIDRLCQFIDYTGLTSSQFADTAGIPRPSLSQMLHGRNKSLNNQVLSKLNDAFPNLNIVWLLFGNGDMLTNSNFEISEPQTSIENTKTDILGTDTLQLNSRNCSDKISVQSSAESPSGDSLNTSNLFESVQSDCNAQPQQKQQPNGFEPPILDPSVKVSLSKEAGKRVTSTCAVF